MPGKVIEIHDGTHDVGYVRENVQEARALQWAPSRCKVSVSDHKHCLVCWWAMYASDDEARCQGYEAEDNWLCVECYTRFIRGNELS